MVVVPSTTNKYIWPALGWSVPVSLPPPNSSAIPSNIIRSRSSLFNIALRSSFTIQFDTNVCTICLNKIKFVLRLTQLYVYFILFLPTGFGLKRPSSGQYLLTYSTAQSPSWQTNWFAASQEIPHISRNPKVHYRTHKSPPTVPILGQPNPVHIPTSHFLEIHPNIINPSTPRSPQWSLSLRFPRYAPHAQPISFYHEANIYKKKLKI